MSWKESIVWTALPDGMKAGKLRLTVMVAPRLQTNELLPGKATPVLQQFPHFVDWPATLAKLTLTVRVKPPAQPAQTLASEPDLEGAAPQSQLWTGLFKAATPVEAFEFKRLDDRLIHSFPALNVMSFLKERYTDIATASPTRFPGVRELAHPEKGFGQLAFARQTGVGTFVPEQRKPYDRIAEKQGVDVQRLVIEDIKAETRARLQPLFGGGKVIPPGPPSPVSDFLQVKYFHLPRATKRLPVKIAKPELDFHRMLTALGSHPALLRRLGLAVDLLVTPPSGLPANGRLWVEVSWPAPAPAPPPDSSPRTEYLYVSTAHPAVAFQARPRSGSDLEGRMLKLGGAQFGVVQVDADGAAEKAMQLAANLARMLSPAVRSVDTPQEASVPSLQSAGITVVRTGRAAQLSQHFQASFANNTELEASHEVVLWAEDLTRGYRIDVLDATTGAWRSLCRRAVTYEPLGGGPAITVPDEETCVSSAVTSSTDESEPGGKDLFLHESLFRWPGWSLAVARPGKLLDAENKASEFENLPESGFPLRVSTGIVKGSLPRLRYGRGYRVRARAVDLAGNGLTLADADAVAKPPLLDVVATDKGFVYRRCEPLQQPIVVLRNALEGSPGETAERMVIRSFNDQPAKDAIASSESSERHLAPAAVAQLPAELHGMFDGPAGVRPDAYPTIVGNEGTFAAKVYPEEQLKLPYLPDPLARGAAFLGLPQKAPLDNSVTVHRAGGGEEKWAIAPPPKPPIAVHQVEFAAAPAWPDAAPFRVRIAGTIHPRDPEWDAARRVLTVFLAPAEMARVKLSAFLDKEDLPLLALWEWIAGAGKAGELERRALAGLHWMLTPHRELELVHAVQQPLVIPEFKTLASHRGVGDNFTILADDVPIDGRSTVKLDLLAAWDEPIDTGPEPVRVAGRGHAFEVKLLYGDTLASFGPTKKVSYVPLAIAASADVAAATVPAAPAAPAGRPQLRRVEPPAAAAEQPRVRAVGEAVLQPAGITAAAAQIAPLEVAARTRTLGRHELGDTRYRRITYTAVATSRFREYLPFSDAEIAAAETNSGSKKITRRSQPRAIDVLSSARPAAPRIVYVVPTFGWTRSAAGGTLKSERRGGGLRVYLERPWFSSGDGELLGVVIGQPLRPAAAGTVGLPLFPNALKPYFTQWGMDPIWAGAPTPVQLAPELAQLRNPAATETDLTLDELEGARVSVAGYVVGRWDSDGTLHGYDAERGLWYCDLEIDPGEAYFPFVRLALARYQPKSLRWATGDVKLSRVVLADFAQLTPDRTVSVTQASETVLNVAVTGVTYRESAADRYARTGSAIPMQVAPAADQQPPVQRRGGELAARPRLPAGGGGIVEVSVETRTGSGGELGWVLVPDSTVELQAGAAVGARRTWTGKLTLPAPRGSKPFRLVVRESEPFIVDGEPGKVGAMLRTPTGLRLVFAETLEL